MKKAFIEHDFPVKEVSKHSAREKNIRHGHISTLHIWWARRPLGASRATIYASLVPKPKDEKEREERSKFIADLSKWENSNNKELIEKARQDILDANDGVPPKVLDPFAGGGAIPLEALRLGCETYASDLNPVAVLIEKATLEYPQKYGQPIPRKQYFAERSWMKDDKTQITFSDDTVNPLLEDVKYWGNYVLEEAKKELGKFYPIDPDGSIPVGYIWARTLPCDNPNCRVVIPLVSQTWLSKKTNKKVAYKLIPDGSKIRIGIYKNDEIDFDPGVGTISRANIICPCCNTGIPGKKTRRRFQNGESSERMIAVINRNPETPGKNYRVPKKQDMDSYLDAANNLEVNQKTFMKTWGIDPIPDEPTPLGGGSGAERAFSLRNYGLNKWGDLFNERQKNSLIIVMNLIHKLKNSNNFHSFERDYQNVIIRYIGNFISKGLATNNSNCRWNSNSESIAGKPDQFGTMQMQWIYPEAFPFSNVTGSFHNHLNDLISVLTNLNLNNSLIQVSQNSATSLQFENGSLDAVFTDPPYYDNIPYSDLSDFFYVWDKRIFLDSNELISTPLTPKTEEIIQDASRNNYDNKEAKEFFENLLSKAFMEAARVINDKGIINIVYAHKSLEAWESIINSIIISNLYLTGSWPIKTERKARPRAQGSAALASSIYMVCRKRNTNETAFYNEIKPAIEKRIHKKLDQFWAEGISGSDFFISAIGPGVEVFGQYAKVERLSGEELTVKELLEFIRRVVSEYALSKILKSPQLGGIDNNTRFYLIWRFTYGNAKVIFDDASKLARAIGFDIEANWDSAGIVNKQKEWISIKSPVDRRNDERFQRRIAKHFPAISQETIFDDDIIEEPPSMIDVLHQCLIFWGRNDRLTIAKLLEGSGYRNNNHFWQVAQSISDVLPDGDKEKQLIQGFLYGKEGYQSGKIPVDIPVQQENLFEEGQ